MARTEKGDALKRGHPVYTNIIYRRRDDPSFGATLLTSASCPGSEADLGDWPKLNRHTLASCPVPDPIVSEYKGESAGTGNFRGGSPRQPNRLTLASCPVPDPIVSEYKCESSTTGNPLVCPRSQVCRGDARHPLSPTRTRDPEGAHSPARWPPRGRRRSTNGSGGEKRQ